VDKKEFKLIVVNKSKECAIRAMALTAVNEVVWCKDFRSWVCGKDEHEIIKKY